MRRLLNPALVSLVAATAGCYTWTELPRTEMTAGRRVRVTLRSGTAESLGEQAELPGLRRRFEADVQAAEFADAVGLLLPGGGATPAGRSGLSAFLSVPWSVIENVEQKKFSPRRTVALAGAAAVATAIVLSLEGGGTQNGQNPPPINERVRIPLFRLIFR